MELNSPYILTNSGRKVGPSIGAPSLDDIVLALSRQPRFGGHGRVFYSVLDHSLFVEELAATFGYVGKVVDSRFRLAALLHDAHEAMTGDIPSPFKTREIRHIQDGLDTRLLAELMPETPWLLQRYHITVKSLDTRALLAEALVVGPPALVTPEHVSQHFSREPLPKDVEMLEQMRARHSRMGAVNTTGIFHERFATLRQEVLETL
jgi:hypothetical protein